MGTETVAYGVLALMTPWLLQGLAETSFEVWVFDSLLILATIPFAVGWALRGSPVFRLMRISVRRQDGANASGLQCGLRSLIAWLPFVCLSSLQGFVLAAWLSERGDAGTLFSQSATIYGFLSVAALSIGFVLAAIYSTVSPQRGLQDLLAGTRLILR